MSTFVLVPGMWLGDWAWQSVTTALRDAGHDVHPMTLTGVSTSAPDPSADLDTHVADIVRLINERGLSDVVLVGHSYGGMPVSVAASQLGDRLAAVVYVDSAPLPEGMSQFDTNEPEAQEEIRAQAADTGMVPPPPFDPASDPVNLAGLDSDALQAMRDGAAPHPFASAIQPVHYDQGHREPGAPAVPTALVACALPEKVVHQMISAGHPMFAGLVGAQIVGLPTGHWPMFSEPERLAAILDGLAKS